MITDIDECSDGQNICGDLGSCMNNIGGFYECNCQLGAVAMGDNSQGTLTCVGQFQSNLV